MAPIDDDAIFQLFLKKQLYLSPAQGAPLSHNALECLFRSPQKTSNSAVERFALHSKLLNINKTQLKNCNRKLAPLYGVSLESGAVLFFA